MSTKILTILACLILLTGVVVYGSAHFLRANQKQLRLERGFTISYTLAENGQLFARSIREVKENGEFFEDTDYLNADGSSKSHSKLAGTLAHGSVVIDDSQKKLKYLGNAALVQAKTEAEFRQSKDFNREESLLGYKVLVSRRCDAQNQCSEFWNAPTLGGEPLKIVIPNGAAGVVKEATDVRFGEPSFTVPDYPVDNSNFQHLQQRRSQAPR